MLSLHILASLAKNDLKSALSTLETIVNVEKTRTEYPSIIGSERWKPLHLVIDDLLKAIRESADPALLLRFKTALDHSKQVNGIGAHPLFSSLTN
jgi:hypothetical protein